MSRPVDPNHDPNNKELMFKRRIRSFVKREGRFTDAQKEAFTRSWGKFGVDFKDEILDLANLFNREADTILEIGFGNGDSLAKMALDNPDKNYLGIEVHRPGVGQLLKQIEYEDIENIRVSTHDAIEVITKQIPENSLTGVQIFFADPWPKKRHHKRRIIQTPFMSLLATKIQSNGFIHLATDWANYAAHMLDVMQNHPDFMNTAEVDFIPRPDFRPLTKFEQRGLNLGHEIFDLMFLKNS